MRAARLCGATGEVGPPPSLHGQAQSSSRLPRSTRALSTPTGIFGSLGDSPGSCELYLPERRAAEPRARVTLVDFFTDSALLSLLEVLAALGELRPLERTSSAMGEARPSGLAACFFLPLRRVDIWGEHSQLSTARPLGGSTPRAQPGTKNPQRFTSLLLPSKPNCTPMEKQANP